MQTNNQTQQETQEFSQEEFLASCRRQLIEENLLVYEDGQYFLTDKGKLRAEKELQRYQMMPARMLLIEQYILQRHGFIVY